MYELKQGTARLVSALYRRREDKFDLAFLATTLNYVPEQLKEDIEALHDFFEQQEREDSET